MLRSYSHSSQTIHWSSVSMTEFIVGHLNSTLGQLKVFISLLEQSKVKSRYSCISSFHGTGRPSLSYCLHLFYFNSVLKTSSGWNINLCINNVYVKLIAPRSRAVYRLFISECNPEIVLISLAVMKPQGTNLILVLPPRLLSCCRLIFWNPMTHLSIHIVFS